MDVALRLQMERDIKSIIQSSEVVPLGSEDWLTERLMMYFEDNAVYITGIH